MRRNPAASLLPALALGLALAGEAAPAHALGGPDTPAAPPGSAPGAGAPPAPGADPDAGARGFPKPEELKDLGPGPSLADLQRTPTVRVEEWTLAGPFPDRVGTQPYAPEGPIEKILDDAVAARAGLATSSEALRCTARELGRVLLAKDAMPDVGLVDWIAARCGTPAPQLRPAWILGKAPAEAPVEELLPSLRQGVDDMVARSLSGGAVAAGIWFGREGDEAAVVLVTAPRTAQLEAFSPVAEAGRITFRGEILEPVDDIGGTVNQGRFGFADCTPDPAVALPAFALTCPLAEGDEAALVEVLARPRGRVLGRTVLRTLARRPGAEVRTYRAPRIAPATEAGDDLPAAFLGAVNAVRSQAGLPAYALSPAQSKTAERLAPHILGAAFGLSSPTAGDLAALGLAAGWDVGAPIRDAELASGWQPGSSDVGLLVDAIARSPSGRATLLAPDGTVLAVGAEVSQDPPALAAVVSSYEIFDAEDLAEGSRQLAQRLSAARRDRGLETRTLPDPVQQVLDRVVQGLPKGETTPQAALQEAVGGASQALGRSVRGWVLQAESPLGLPFPDELLTAPDLSLALAVGYYRPADEPWGRYVAVVVAAEPDVSI